MNDPTLPADTWLDSPTALAQWLENVPAGLPVGLDSEFERTNTFFARPALIQLAVPGDYRLVEPTVVEETPAFSRWLADPQQAKLLYAVSEDADLFREWLGVALAGVLDLQLAAAMAGQGYSVGYANLVESLLGHRLSKTQTRSDWLQRPLSAEQLAYALDDVRYLHPLYEVIQPILADRGLEAAAWEETGRFLQEQQEQSDPASYVQRLRGAWFLPPEGQHRLARLVAWREAECRQRDRPRGRVLADPLLITLAEKAPRSRQALAAIDGLPPVVVRKYAEPLLEILAAPASSDGPLIDPPLTKAEQETYRALRDILKARAADLDVPPELVAPRRKLEAAIRALRREESLPALFTEGWRGRILSAVIPELESALPQPLVNGNADGSSES